MLYHDLWPFVVLQEAAFKKHKEFQEIMETGIKDYNSPRTTTNTKMTMRDDSGTVSIYISTFKVLCCVGCSLISSVNCMKVWPPLWYHSLC